MARKPSFNNTGSPPTLAVDELLGEAYRVVRAVEENLDDIRNVAENITDINDVANAVEIIQATSLLVENNAAQAAASVSAAILAKTQAETAETNSELAETNAGESAAAALVSRLAAEEAEGVVEGFANDAAASAIAADNSAADAAASAIASANSATASEGSANTAGGHTTTAGNYKTAAEIAEANAEAALASALDTLAAAQAARDAALAAQTAAEAAQAASEAGWDDFDDKYLGAKSTNPTLDNDGDPLEDGAIFWHTTAKEWRVYDLAEPAWFTLSAGSGSASTISNTPYGDIESVNVQDALNELDADKLSAADFDTDATLAANSDVKIASQKATKTYVDNRVNALNTAVITTDEFVGDGTADFLLSFPPNEKNSCWPVVGGVEQPPSTFGLVGDTITFTENIPIGVKVHVKYIGGGFVAESGVNAVLAADSATAADASEAAAAASAIAADGSETAAAASAVAADASATASAGSASTAATQAGIASGHNDTALTHANTAETQAGISTTQAGIATTKAGEAAASAVEAANQASSLKGTSTTSVSIGLGSKSLTTQAGKNFAVGTDLKITSDAGPLTHYLSGVVTAYNNATGALTFDVGKFGGTGSRADWSIRVAGTYANSILAGDEVVFTASGALTQANRGMLLVGNSATTITLTLDPVADLGASFLAILTNVGAGLLTLAIDGAGTFSDGTTTKVIATDNSVIIACNGADIRVLEFASGGGGGSGSLGEAYRRNSIFN